MAEKRLNRQIKSKRRVAEHGEVFTAEREVNAMLDLVGSNISSITTTVLEPAVGEGIFLLKILDRRLAAIDRYGVTGWNREWHVLQAIATLYGIDIQRDNVMITRRNISDKANLYLRTKYITPSVGFDKALDAILKRNIVAGNTLTCSELNGLPLKLSEWTFQRDGTITRMDFPLQELINNGGQSTAKHRMYSYNWMQKTSRSSDRTVGHAYAAA